MPEYLAVFKTTGAATPAKAVLQANTVMSAIQQMCLSAGVHSTSSLLCFELYEITENGKAYVPVASKDDPEVKEQRLKRRAFKQETVVVPLVKPPVVSTEEADYINCAVEEA